MLMTKIEIVSSYKRADNKKNQIKILSELNGCEEKEIKSILLQNKVIIPLAVLKRGKVNIKKELNNILNMQAAGQTQYEIAAVYGVSQATISNLLNKEKAKEEVRESVYTKRSNKTVQGHMCRV